MDETTIDGFNACLAADAPLSLPPTAYTGVSNQLAEAGAIFARGWVGVGRADQIANPGDYRTVDIADHPVILIRDKDGTANALANTCRHRGARLLDGEGNTKGIRCPFHAWAYRLNGELIATPRMNIDTTCHNLHQYACEERHGFLFISFEPTPSNLDEQLGDFAEIHTPWRLETLVTTRRWTKEFNCDWKAFIDVFNEYYHLPYVHRDSIDGVYN
ncbi:MAG: aromatic ring-hydroxylating oxygenase subunit alpha, partial [Pikeienuella sp.]